MLKDSSKRFILFYFFGLLCYCCCWCSPSVHRALCVEYCVFTWQTSKVLEIEIRNRRKDAMNKLRTHLKCFVYTGETRHVQRFHLHKRWSDMEKSASGIIVARKKENLHFKSNDYLIELDDSLARRAGHAYSYSWIRSSWTWKKFEIER